MKKSILAIAFLALTTISCKTDKKKLDTSAAVKEEIKIENPIDSYKANIAESTITWVGSKKPVGTHNGDIKILNGVFDVKNGDLKAGEFTIDMKSINCTDLDANTGKDKLEGHLKNVDFFDVENFPTAKFVVTNSITNGDKLNVTGNFTLKGVTKSITIPATIYKENNNIHFKSDVFNLDRTDFGVNYKSKKINAALKDKFINDLIELCFDIKAKK